MRRALALPLLLLLTASVAPGRRAPPERLRLAPDAESRWIPFDLTPGNQIRFTMTLEGRPATAILDTGVSFSIIALRSPLVDPRRIRAGGSATAIGGPVAVGWMPTRSIVIGALTRSGGGLYATNLPAIATGTASPVDLLIGRDLLGAQALDIDYPNRRFRILPSGRLPFTGASAPLAISSSRRVYESVVTIGGRRIAPVIVDTGDGAAVTLSPAAWADSVPGALRTTTTISYGLAGGAVATLAIIPTLQIGEQTVRHVEVRAEAAGGFSHTIGVAGRIGSGLLQGYRVLLDPGAARMVLKAGTAGDAMPLRSTSGLLVAIGPDRLHVLHVMRNSPAANGEWRAGETICSIDGQPVTPTYAAGPTASWSVGTPGRVVALGLCDGRFRTLTLASFY